MRIGNFDLRFHGIRLAWQDYDKKIRGKMITCSRAVGVRMIPDDGLSEMEGLKKYAPSMEELYGEPEKYFDTVISDSSVTSNSPKGLFTTDQNNGEQLELF